MGDEENEFKVNRHAVREYLEVLRPKAIQSCQSYDIWWFLTVTLNLIYYSTSAYSDFENLAPA